MNFMPYSKKLELMQADLEAHRLEVCLVPLNPRLRNWNEFGMMRVCVDVPPKWYRRLCASHISQRAIRKGKPDTLIKRAHTLAARQRLIDGKAPTTKYELRIMEILPTVKL